MKRFLTFCLVISVGFNMYLYNTEYVVRDDFNDNYDHITPEIPVNDHVKLAQSAILKKEDCGADQKAFLRRKPTQKKNASTKDEIDKEDEAPMLSEVEIREKLEARYNEWVEKSDNFFIDELDITAEQVAAYRNLSKQRQSEITDYFNRKTKDAKEDSPSAYMFTSDDTIFMGRLAQKYENLLKENFGEENYKKHKQFIKNHNDTIMTDEFVQVVEF